MGSPVHQWSDFYNISLRRHTMVQVAITFREVEMFPCLLAALNGSNALDLLERVFFDSRPNGHLGPDENHCTGCVIVMQ